jgi:carbon-monoxide dehydrogenase large subunit
MQSRATREETPRRREDPPLLTGNARYTDDFSPSDTTHAAVLRSQYARARIDSIDTSRVEALDGILAVLTADDLAESDAPGVFHVSGKLPVTQQIPDIPILASDIVRYTGEPVAVVVAEDRYLAHDAVSRIDIEYERLDAVTRVDEALDGHEPLVHASMSDNRAFDWRFGDHKSVEQAFSTADHTVRLDLTNQRVLPNPLEPRAVIGDYDTSSGTCTVRMSTQTPHRIRDQLVSVLGLRKEDTRVIAPAVGGGFGSKTSPPKQTEPLIVWASMQVGRPVKWVATRSESHQADHPGRDMRARGELAVDDDGTVRALRVNATFNLGAYTAWGRTPAYHFHHILSGQYDIPEIAGRLVGGYTNTTPVAPYRGAGRPESIFVVERLMNRAASVVGMDPAELRLRNFIPADAFPVETAVGAVYDSGNYERAMENLLEKVEYETLRERQESLRDKGRHLGIGISCAIENIGTQRPETARVEIDESGVVTAYCGTVDTGQGHSTTFADVLAAELGIPADDIQIREGDSGDLPRGTGTFASRSTPVGASALVRCAKDIVKRARQLASQHLDVPAGSLTFSDGQFQADGATRTLTLQEIAELAGQAEDCSALVATMDYEPDSYAYPFGAHVAVVEVDPVTGKIDLQRYVTIDDCGVQLNPTLVEGQIHGGVAQGIGQALYEEAVYDDNGTLLSGSLQDYALPKATDIPEMDVGETTTPCPHTPTGAKGVGESGATAAPPAVVNAVVDALSPLDVTNLDMPITAETVWQAVRD